MTQYKMVVLDMDDTLMNSDNKLSIETKSYLLDIQKRGYYVVLASGRQQKVCYLLRDLELNKYNSFIISYNGGKTINMANENVEVDQPVSKKDFDNIVDYCRDKNF